MIPDLSTVGLFVGSVLAAKHLIDRCTAAVMGR